MRRRSPSRAGKYVPAIEGFALRSKPGGHGPAAMAPHRLDSAHVDGIDVGPLLAVHFDRDVVFIDIFGDLDIVERLFLHDVAPVAGRIADAQQDGAAEAASGLEGFISPGMPVHGVVGVLQEIGAAFQQQTIREPGRTVFVEMPGAGFVGGAATAPGLVEFPDKSFGKGLGSRKSSCDRGRSVSGKSAFAGHTCHQCRRGKQRQEQEARLHHGRRDAGVMVSPDCSESLAAGVRYHASLTDRRWRRACDFRDISSPPFFG